jgi:hypothetical protein
MKPSVHGSCINRRVLLSTLAGLPIPALLLSTPALTQDVGTQLASWNGGAAKQAIIDFVRHLIRA